MNKAEDISLQLPPILADSYSELVALCQTHHIQSLHAIGSVLDPQRFRPGSDIDLVYVLDEAAIPDKMYNANLFGFWDALEVLFNRKVDLVHRPSLRNPYLIEEIEETQLLLYEQKSSQVPMGY